MLRCCGAASFHCVAATLQRKPSLPTIASFARPPTRAWTRCPVLITRIYTSSSAAGAPGTRTSIASERLRGRRPELVEDIFDVRQHAAYFEHGASVIVGARRAGNAPFS